MKMASLDDYQIYKDTHYKRIIDALIPVPGIPGRNFVPTYEGDLPVDEIEDWWWVAPERHVDHAYYPSMADPKYVVWTFSMLVKDEEGNLYITLRFSNSQWDRSEIARSKTREEARQVFLRIHWEMVDNPEHHGWKAEEMELAITTGRERPENERS
jgi:hypothetical protein